MFPLFVLVLIAFSHSIVASKHEGADNSVSFDTATEMYLYAWPLVITSLTRESMFYLPDNLMLPLPVFPNPNLTAIVKPNVDTLYDACWINHEKVDDLVLTIPDTTDGLYYLFPLMDAWSNIVASPGWRTTGKGQTTVLIRWQYSNKTDPAPGEYDMVIKSPTATTYLLGRTNVADQSDLRPTQEQLFSYRLKPQFEGDAEATSAGADAAAAVAGRGPLPSPSGTTVEDIFAMGAAEFFNTFAELMVANPPLLPQDEAIVSKMQEEFGLIPGQPWNFATSIGADQRRALEAGQQKGVKAIYTYPVKRANGWTLPSMQTGNFSSDYYLRAYIALVLYCANVPQDAVYYETEVLPGGSNEYELVFPAGSLPPNDEFWSVTMYSEEGYLVANADAIYSISSQQDLVVREDGAVHITISMVAPEDRSGTNWLPAPQAGEGFSLTLRVYWPQEPILDGSWVPPAVNKLQ